MASNLSLFNNRKNTTEQNWTSFLAKVSQSQMEHKPFSYYGSRPNPPKRPAVLDMLDQRCSA